MFTLQLVPQRMGYLLYPFLDIQVYNSNQCSGQNDSTSSVSCETDLQNLGESILVVPDLISTTVSINPANGIDETRIIDVIGKIGAG